VRFAPFPTCSVSPPRGSLYPARLSRDAAHTLRRIPLVSSRTASPRPLPSCRYPSPCRHFVSAGFHCGRSHLVPAATRGPPAAHLCLRSHADTRSLLLLFAPCLARPRPLEWSRPDCGMVRQSFTSLMSFSRCSYYCRNPRSSLAGCPSWGSSPSTEADGLVTTPLAPRRADRGWLSSRTRPRPGVMIAHAACVTSSTRR
jgi:hypothetical protein